MYLFHQRFGERLLFAVTFAAFTLLPIGLWTAGLWAAPMNPYLFFIVPLSAFSLPFAIFFAYRVFSRKPGLVIDDAGITVNMALPFWINQFIPWSEVGGVMVRTDQVYWGFFDTDRVILFLHPICRGRFSQEPQVQVTRKWFQWGRLGPPCSFVLTQKGVDADAIRAALKCHGKLHK